MIRQQKKIEEVKALALSIDAGPIPLKMDADGVLRVGGTRVTLDTVAAAFDEGATPEEIVFQYPSLDLADVYSVVSYYLRRRSDVEAYLRERQEQANKIREQTKSEFDPAGVRDRLLARRSGQDR